MRGLPSYAVSVGGGHFVNVASVGTYEVSPTAAVYCATKFAVRALSEGLRQESTGDIRVISSPRGRPSPNRPTPSPTPLPGRP
ncbi:hypothetical protein GCM10009863_56420 [Streptomyces axinellae]|uniref:Uncharacterized protein n=1 Tax=Streptomyces axinellae TaxID=552788 RepID=A0ABN3QRY8_9ACTN